MAGSLPGVVILLGLCYHDRGHQCPIDGAFDERVAGQGMPSCPEQQVVSSCNHLASLIFYRMMPTPWGDKVCTPRALHNRSPVRHAMTGTLVLALVPILSISSLMLFGAEKASSPKLRKPSSSTQEELTTSPACRSRDLGGQLGSSHPASAPASSSGVPKLYPFLVRQVGQRHVRQPRGKKLCGCMAAPVHRQPSTWACFFRP